MPPDKGNEEVSNVPNVFENVSFANYLLGVFFAK